MAAAQPLTAPVAIAGAGPVGLALAVGLAHHGIGSVVLEESPSLSAHSKAPGVLPRTLEIFAGWNVLEPFLDRGTFLTQPSGWTPGRDEPVFTIDLSPLAETTAIPGVLIIPQHRTEQLLFEAASATGLVDVRFGHRVTGFEQDGAGVTVSVATATGEQRVRADYLVGCDGAHSAVRDTLGLALEGKTYPARLLLADVRITDGRDTLPWPRVSLRGRGIVGGIRIEPSTWRLIATLEPATSDDAAMSDAHVRALVELLLGAGPFAPVWASVFRIHCRTSPQFRRGRVLIAGDAAHINSPAGGQGMNSGIQDAHNLAWKLARAIGGGRADDLLASYEAERRPVVLTYVDRYTDLLTRGILIAPSPVRTAVLGVMRFATSQPLIARRLLPRAAMFDTRYGASPLISGRGSLLGARAPDAPLTKAGAPVRLHDLFARDAALLLFDDGRLPGWNVADVEPAVRGIRGLQVARIVRSTAHADDVVDTDGAVWRSWSPRPGTAALVRPDAYVGWMSERPTLQELRAGVMRALGA